MYKILYKEVLSDVNKLMVIEAPDVARKAKAGQFVIVRIDEYGERIPLTVADYDPRDRGLERQVVARLGVRKAIVIKTAGGLDPLQLRRSLTHFAAPWISRWIAERKTLAIAGGRTMQWLVQEMEAPPGAKGLVVIQAMGNIDATVGPYDALELGRALARRWQGDFLTLNTPAIVPDARTRRTVLQLASVRPVVERLHEIESALVGVGTLRNSVFLERGVLTGKDLSRLSRSGAVGEICGRFFDRDGNECRTSYRQRVISVGLDDLRRADDVIAVVAGSDRTEAILGALRGGLIRSLVIDREGAVSLLAATSTGMKRRKSR